MNIAESTVGDLVARDVRAAEIFERYKIDFCCNGHRTLRQACGNAESVAAVEAALRDLSGTTGTGDNPYLDYRSWPLDLLADFIEKKLHRETSGRITAIQAHLEKICRVHGGKHPELVAIRDLFDKSAGELSAHMKREELILFPYIRKTILTGKAPGMAFGTVANPIRVLTQEHQDEGERFRQIALLTNDYTVPADGCTTYRLTFQELREFESMLHFHIHLENNLLFPRALALTETSPS